MLRIYTCHPYNIDDSFVLNISLNDSHINCYYLMFFMILTFSFLLTSFSCPCTYPQGCIMSTMLSLFMCCTFTELTADPLTSYLVVGCEIILMLTPSGVWCPSERSGGRCQWSSSGGAYGGPHNHNVHCFPSLLCCPVQDIHAWSQGGGTSRGLSGQNIYK